MGQVWWNKGNTKSNILIYISHFIIDKECNTIFLQSFNKFFNYYLIIELHHHLINLGNLTLWTLDIQIVEFTVPLLPVQWSWKRIHIINGRNNDQNDDNNHARRQSHGQCYWHPSDKVSISGPPKFHVQCAVPHSTVPPSAYLLDIHTQDYGQASASFVDMSCAWLALLLSASDCRSESRRQSSGMSNVIGDMWVHLRQVS